MRYVRMMAAMALTLALVGLWRPAGAQGATASVSIKDFKFDPVTLSVKTGTSVNWTNDGATAHTVTASDGSWDSGNLEPGATFSHAFTADGSVSYYCKYHGSATGTGMAGSLTVAQETQPTIVPTTPPSGPTPSITAIDQPIINNTITVAEVVAAQDGWIAVHKNGPDGKLLVSPIVGLVAVKAGTWTTVQVPLSESFKAGDTLYPMLHIDAGTTGTYEFPGPDSPVQVNGNVILTTIKVTDVSAPPAATPSISAVDQPIVNNTITVAKVVAAQDGWIAVHKNGPDGKLLVSPIVGLAPVKAGTWENVKVTLTESFKAGDTLYPMLHIDAGTIGTYEFPGADSPVQVDGNVILATLKVTQPAATPSISAVDQPIVNNTITVAKVVAAQDGWIAVHKNGPDGKLLVSPIVGLAPVKAGTWENVKVTLTESFKAGDTLYPMLHIDAGTIGTYEFPGADSPVQVDGNIILVAIKVTGGMVPPSLPNTGGSPLPTALLVAGALALLGLGFALVRRRRLA